MKRPRGVAKDPVCLPPGYVLMLYLPSSDRLHALQVRGHAEDGKHCSWLDFWPLDVKYFTTIGRALQELRLLVDLPRARDEPGAMYVDPDCTVRLGDVCERGAVRRYVRAWGWQAVRERVRLRRLVAFWVDAASRPGSAGYRRARDAFERSQ